MTKTFGMDFPVYILCFVLILLIFLLLVEQEINFKLFSDMTEIFVMVYRFIAVNIPSFCFREKGQLDPICMDTVQAETVLVRPAFYSLIHFAYPFKGNIVGGSK